MSTFAHPQFPEATVPSQSLGVDSDPLADKIAFPQLTEVELAEVALGERRLFAEDEALFRAGEYQFNRHAILSRTVRVVDVSTGERVVFARHGPGYFSLRAVGLRYKFIYCGDLSGHRSHGTHNL